MISSQHHYICRAPFPQILGVRRLAHLFSSVTQLCPTLCDPIMDCSMPGFPVHHQLPEFTQIHVHRVRCHPTISSSVVPFSSCLQSSPASGSFSVSQFCSSGGQSIEASASVLPINIQDWFSLGLRSNQSLLRKSVLNIHWRDWCWNWSSKC